MRSKAQRFRPQVVQKLLEVRASVNYGAMRSTVAMTEDVLNFWQQLASERGCVFWLWRLCAFCVGSLAFWLRGFLASWFIGFQTILLVMFLSFLASWLFGFFGLFVLLCYSNLASCVHRFWGVQASLVDLLQDVQLKVALRNPQASGLRILVVKRYWLNT